MNVCHGEEGESYWNLLWGVQTLQTQRQESPEILYLTWMGMFLEILHRNEVVNLQ